MIMMRNDPYDDAIRLIASAKITQQKTDAIADLLEKNDAVHWGDHYLTSAWKHLQSYFATRQQVHRLIMLCQENQDFFGDPPAGTSVLDLLGDKLEELIGEYRE